MNLNLDLVPYFKVNAKWIIDLNIKPQTLKLLQYGGNLWPWIRLRFLRYHTPKAYSLEERIKNYTLPKLKTSAFQKIVLRE